MIDALQPQPTGPGARRERPRGRDTRRFRITIVTQLTLLVLTIAVPLSALLAWDIRAQFHTDQVAAANHAMGIANTVATRAEIRLDLTRTLLMHTAARPAVRALDRSRCDPLLAELHQLLPGNANINTFNLGWEYVCSAVPRSSAGIVRSDHLVRYNDKIKSVDDMFLSDPVRGQLTGKLVVIAVYPVKDGAGGRIGAVTAPIDLPALAPIIADPTLPEQATVKLVNGAGYIVTSYPETAQIGRATEGAPLASGLQRIGTWVDVGRDGIERIYARAPVKGSDWVAIAGLPTGQAFAEFRRHRDREAMTLVFLLLFSGSLAILVAGRISRPLRTLRKDAGILANGNLAHRSQVATRDETGHLAVAFNDMAQALETHAAASKEAAAGILRLNRVYAVLSGINGAIVRIRDRDELYREVCRIAVADGGFQAARMIALDAHGRADMVAAAGTDTIRLERVLDEHNRDLERSPTVIALVLKGGKPVISNDVASDERFPNRATLTAEGNFALALLPVIIGKRISAALLLRTREPGVFDAEELRLLVELVGNLSFALELIDKQGQLDYLAFYDALTGLANRRLFLERVTQHLRVAASGGHRLALFMIDLERFKNINDTLGRAAGDALLKQVAAWLTAGAGDVNLVARIGADHFALVAPEISQGRDVVRLLEKKLGDFLEHSFLVENTTFRIAFKVGIALYPNDGADADALFRNAEAALKRAKAAGDRYLFYTQTMTATIAGQLTLENQLRQALEKEEFVLHYQPKVNLASGKMTGTEALIRWNDPRTGLVPPGRFIPILEETGMINEVGRWALRRAIADYLRWRAAGLPAVRIAVNVSPLQLRHRGFIDEIREAIGAAEHAAGGLELEITESLIMADVKLSIARLHEIRDLGITIAIDDFGTGFSSLAYLARLPVDTLKIDRSFVIDMTVDREGLALVSTIINLAHSLKLKVVAEGVETEEQRRLLHLLGCDEMQGYLFSKPVPAEVFEARFLAAAMEGVS